MVIATLVLSLMTLPVGAIAKNQEEAISDHCESIRNSLKMVQKNDAKARVHLGGRYETIISEFLMPLNVRLVENNLPSEELVKNQNEFADTKTIFVNDFTICPGINIYYPVITIDIAIFHRIVISYSR